MHLLVHSRGSMINQKTTETKRQAVQAVERVYLQMSQYIFTNTTPVIVLLTSLSIILVVAQYIILRRTSSYLNFMAMFILYTYELLHIIWRMWHIYWHMTVEVLWWYGDNGFDRVVWSLYVYLFVMPR